MQDRPVGCDGQRLEPHPLVEPVSTGVSQRHSDMDAGCTGGRGGVHERLDQAPSVPAALVRRQDVDVKVGREILDPGVQHAFGLIEDLP